MGDRARRWGGRRSGAWGHHHEGVQAQDTGAPRPNRTGTRLPSGQAWPGATGQVVYRRNRALLKGFGTEGNPSAWAKPGLAPFQHSFA